MDTPGKRVYAVRLALGDGWKTPMTMAAFAALLTRKSGTAYDSAKISRIESGERAITIGEAALVASVDPQQRGRAWVAWGETEDVLDLLDPANDRLLTPAEGKRARDAASAQRQAKTTAHKKNKGRQA